MSDTAAGAVAFGCIWLAWVLHDISIMLREIRDRLPKPPSEEGK